MDYKSKYLKYKRKYLNEKNNQYGGHTQKEIYFIRHGETVWNALGKKQGQEADIELNEIGEEQSRKTGKYLKNYRHNNIDFDCVLSSPLKRCKKTAENICEQIDYDKSKITYMNEIMELKNGSLSGLTNNDELMKNLTKYAMDEIALIRDPIEKYKIEIPVHQQAFYNEVIRNNSLPVVGVETYEEILHRVNYLINYLKNTPMKKILVITHSGFLDNFIKILLTIKKYLYICLNKQ